MKDLRSMSDRELADYMTGYKENTAEHFLSELEFKRRLDRGNQFRGWASLGLSVFAIAVSVAALAVKNC